MKLAIGRVLTVLRTPVVRADGTLETALGVLLWLVPGAVAGCAVACAFLLLEPLA